MYRRMLVPLDGSELAESILPYAAEVAARFGLEVILFHGCTGGEAELSPLYSAYMEKATDVLRRESEAIWNRTGRPPGDRRLELQCKVAAGDAADGILRCAEEEEADLILMATHGRSGVTRWALGSVADKVLQASPVPVWLVRAGTAERIMSEEWSQKAVLVPLDGSELAESVLPHVEDLAKGRDDDPMDVILLAVVEPIVYPALDPSFSPVEFHEALEAYAETRRGYIGETEKLLRGRGLEVRSEVQMGSPAEEIVNYADENRIGLVVMATHGRSGISRWVYGSVAERVLTGTSRPVFLVRPGKDS
jgi:nucleotide-binding universal stress UspA family protein